MSTYSFTLIGYSLSSGHAVVEAGTAPDWIAAARVFQSSHKDVQFIAAMAGIANPILLFQSLPLRRPEPAGALRQPDTTFSLFGYQQVEARTKVLHIRAADAVGAAMAAMMHLGAGWRFCAAFDGKRFPIGSWSCFQELSQPPEALEALSR